MLVLTDEFAPSFDDEFVRVAVWRCLLLFAATEMVLAGDLNALDADDYSPEHWSLLEQRANEHGWALPAVSQQLALPLVV